MDLSIIIVSWQSKDRLKKNLQSIFASKTSFNYEVFLVDNNSTDGTVAFVKENYPLVHVIPNQENLGFARANNLAIEQSQGDFILLLNPDMELMPNTIEQALLFAKDKTEAVVSGIRLKNKEGKDLAQIRRLPRFFDQLMIVLKLPHLFPFLLRGYIPPQFDYSQPTQVESIRGSFFLINRKSHHQVSGEELPLLDERYFLWFEEVDFCQHLINQGGEIWYNPQAEAIDLVGQSFAQLTRGQKQVYFKESMLKYFAKWKPTWQYQSLRLAWALMSLFIR